MNCEAFMFRKISTTHQISFILSSKHEERRERTWIPLLLPPSSRLDYHACITSRQHNSPFLSLQCELEKERKKNRCQTKYPQSPHWVCIRVSWPSLSFLPTFVGMRVKWQLCLKHSCSLQKLFPPRREKWELVSMKIIELS